MFNKLKDAIRINKALNQYEEIKGDIDKVDHIKTLLVSKRFWVNVIGLAVTVSGILPAKFGVPLMAAANLGTKLVDMLLDSASNQPPV